jgi:DNA invertase Pin-like site-specific DNA recombinase
MRAIGYFRETRGQSLAEQSEAFLEFCRGNGYEAAATFLDARGSSDLSGFRQMLEFVQAQHDTGFLMVVVPNFQSLGDPLTEAARRYFQVSSLGVPIVGIDSGDDVSANLLSNWSKYRQNGSLGEKVKAAMRRKAVKGEALGRPPYGYRVGHNRRLVVVPEEGSIVRYIFRLYLKDGLGIRRIARRLNEEGLRTRRGGLWSMVTVRDILRNRAYLGTYSRFGVRVPASHAPLISKEDFQKVQDRLDTRRPVSGIRKVSPFLLSSLVYCGYCGNKMIGVSRKQKWQRRSDGTTRVAHYRYYQCESRTNRSLCDYHTHRAEELEEQVRMALSGQNLGTGPGKKPADALSETEAQIRKLRDRVRRLDKKLEGYLDSAAEGSLNQEKLRQAAAALAAEQIQLEQKLSEYSRLARQAADDTERKKHRDSIVDRLRDTWTDLEFNERQELLRESIEKIVVQDDNIEILLKP